MYNGAVVGELPHRYLHSLPREQEEIINDMLREYKYKISSGILTPTDTGIEFTQPQIYTLSLDTEEELFTIPVFTNTKEENERRYNRAKEKEELRKLIEESIENYER